VDLANAAAEDTQKLLRCRATLRANRLTLTALLSSKSKAGADQLAAAGSCRKRSAQRCTR